MLAKDMGKEQKSTLGVVASGQTEQRVLRQLGVVDVNLDAAERKLANHDALRLLNGCDGTQESTAD